MDNKLSNNNGVRGGDVPSSASAASAGAQDVRWLSAITARERQVLAGVVDGQSSRTIARGLGISRRTVEVYRANLLRKTGAADSAELVRRALRAWGGDDESHAPQTTAGV